MFEYKASEAFWKVFYDLPAEQKEAVREKWKVFKINPFDASLRAHKINRLTSLHGTTVYGIHIEGNLIVTFKIVNGNRIMTIDIGTHAVYK